MLNLSDIQHLDAAEAWLEHEDYCNCFKELERISNRDDGRVLTAGNIWRSEALEENALEPFWRKIGEI